MKNKFTKRITSIVLMMTMVIGILSLTGCSVMFPKTINLNDFFTYEISGYDGYGQVSYSFDSDAFSDAVAKVKKVKDTSTFVDMMRMLNREIRGSWDEEDYLENGDTVTYTWNVDEDSIKEVYGIKVSYKDISVKVEGLSEVTTFDPFEDMQVEVDGIAPDGRIKGLISEKYQGIVYQFDKNGGLSNGDIVNITMRELDPEECIREYGGVPSRTSMAYTVEGLSEYVQTVDAIPEVVREQMRNQLDDFIASQYTDPSVKRKVTNYEVLGYCVLAPKSDVGIWNPVYNNVYLVYKAEMVQGLENGSTETVTCYKYLKFKNVIAYGDGTGYVDIVDYENPVVPGWLYSGEDDFYFTSKNNINYAGFSTLDGFLNQCIAAQKATMYVDTNLQ